MMSYLRAGVGGVFRVEKLDRPCLCLTRMSRLPGEPVRKAEGAENM
jgi:hypothetical protein